MKSNKLFASILAAAVLLPSLALAQTTTLDQVPAPIPSAGNLAALNSELLTQSIAVPGGTLYVSTIRQPGPGGQIAGISQTFTPGAASAVTRFLSLTDGKSDLGVPFTAAAGTPTGTVGVTRVAGTSLTLDGEATSGSAKTNKAMWELNIPTTYIAGANIPIVVNANYTGVGTITAVSTTLTVAAYTEIAGVEAALTVSAAQQFTGTAANYTFTVTGTGLVPGQHVVFEVTMLVTSASGANTGHINSVAYQG